MEIQPTNEQNQFYISELESYVKILRANREYSMQRFDILTISIAGGGIYTCFELMRFIYTSKYLNLEQIQSLNWYYKVTAVIFTLVIIANFFSQWTAYKSTSLAIEFTKMTIYKAKNMEVDEAKIPTYQRKSDRFGNITGRLNVVTISLLVIALTCMILFSWFIF